MLVRACAVCAFVCVFVSIFVGERYVSCVVAASCSCPVPSGGTADTRDHLTPLYIGCLDNLLIEYKHHFTFY